MALLCVQRHSERVTANAHAQVHAQVNAHARTRTRMHAHARAPVATWTRDRRGSPSAVARDHTGSLTGSRASALGLALVALGLGSHKTVRRDTHKVLNDARLS